jgi:aspartyl-tRNA(Asn)/glutamyl-tRNA(Gln) amidotransferase subunit C
MSFTPEDVTRLASLARLELSADEIEAFARQLGDILDLARQVQAVETSARDLATEHALAPAPPLRDDVVQPSLDGGGLFKVPRVIGG